MRTSNEGLNLIKKYECLRLEAYLCPAGVWTIGWGHTKGVQKGDKITAYMADAYLTSDVMQAESDIKGCVTVPLTQNQFDALVSFTFNVGVGHLRSSTLLKKVNAQAPKEEIMDEFRRWVYADGEVLDGLVARRESEAQLWGR